MDTSATRTPIPLLQQGAFPPSWVHVEKWGSGAGQEKQVFRLTPSQRGSQRQ